MKQSNLNKAPRPLREFSSKRGIKTQAELAKILGIHESMLSRFLSGERKLSVRSALAISKKTGIEMGELYQ